MKLTSKEKWFVFFAMISSVLICGEYAMTRPSSNALFLTLFSAKGFPWVWLATVPLNFSAIYLYNRFLPKIGPLRILWFIAAITALMNALAGVLYAKMPLLIFFQYAWKDIYILLMIKQLWSMIHCTIPQGQAKYLYGSICGMGTLGAILGSLVPGYLASLIGSEKIFYLTSPAYLILLFVYTMASKRSGINEETFANDLTSDPRPREAISLIQRSPVLIGILLLVVFMQVAISLTEYQFNAHLELEIFDKDLRTEYCGKLGGLINVFSLAMQFLGSFLIIQTLGLRGSHYLVPILLCTSTVSGIVFPLFALPSASYVILKTVDFSLFGFIREMLYVPLQLDAKYRAKAIIDVFAHRTAKALVSLGLLLLQIAAGSFLLQLTSYISIAIFIAWIATVAILFRNRENVLVAA